MIPALTPFPAGGYLVKSADGVHLVVRPMLQRFRLAEIPQHEPRGLWRYWCYTSLPAATLAAAAWEVDAGTEPVGWFARGGVRQPKN